MVVKKSCMFPDKEVIFISYNLLYTSSLIAKDIEKRGLLKELLNIQIRSRATVS